MLLDGARCIGLGLDRVGRLPPRLSIHHDKGVTIPVDVGHEKVDQVAVIELVGVLCRLQVATMRFPSRLRYITSLTPKVARNYIALGQGVVSKRSAESITTTVTQPAVPQLEYRLGHDGSATRLALLT
jgi:hypothetical protein